MSPDVGALRFDPAQHRYWTGTRELLAVTHVLQTAGLLDATWFTPAGRARGGAVHQATEVLDRDGVIPACDPAVAPYVEAYRAFCQEARPVWHGLEQPVADLQLGYAGTPDRWGTLHGEPAVVDLKTGTVPPWAPLQLVAYGRLDLGEPYPVSGRLGRMPMVAIAPSSASPAATEMASRKSAGRATW